MNEDLTSRQKQSLTTKLKIFSCATSLFTQMSYEKVKISDICKAADVSIGAFYHHFPTKESILNEGYHEFDEELKKSWSEYIPSSQTDGICFLIKCQLEAISVNGYIYATQFFKNQLSNELKYILDKDRYFYITLYQTIERAVSVNELNGGPSEIADHILRTSRGTIYDWCLHSGSYDLISRGINDIKMILYCYSKRQIEL